MGITPVLLKTAQVLCPRQHGSKLMVYIKFEKKSQKGIWQHKYLENFILFNLELESFLVSAINRYGPVSIYNSFHGKGISSCLKLISSAQEARLSFLVQTTANVEITISRLKLVGLKSDKNIKIIFKSRNKIQ